MAQRVLLTSESVADGHPDKICDQVSDAILDACLEQDPTARVAVETAVKSQTLCLLGELTTSAEFDATALARRVVADIGHADGRWGVDPAALTIVQVLSRQSPDIGQGVGLSDGDIGAGDQGMMFGYACRQTPELMPLPIQLAHRLMERHRALRQTASGRGLGPDAKAQVTVAYEGGRPVGIDTVVLSTQHEEAMSLSAVKELVREEILAPMLPDGLFDPQRTRILVNPTGRFVLGGPAADAGLTGRKIIVDTYGGAGRHGGGAFSGKDPTKVDRSAAYAARQLAMSVVAAGLAEEAEVQVSYAIGRAEPVSITLWAPGHRPEEAAEMLAAVAPDAAAMLAPAAIIDRLGLRRPIYRRTASFGHFGRAGLPWEEPLAQRAAMAV